MDELLSKKEKYTLVSQETVFETGLVSKILDILAVLATLGYPFQNQVVNSHAGNPKSPI